MIPSTSVTSTGAIGAGLILGTLFTALAAFLPASIIGSAILIILSLWVMQRQAGLFNLRSLSIPGFCFWNYLAIIMIPSFWIYADQKEPFRTDYLVAVQSGLVSIPLGVAAANRWCRYSNDETTSYFQRPFRQGTLDPTPASYCFVLGLALILMSLHFLQVRTVPLFYLIAHPGQHELLGRLREESGKLLNSRLNYLYSLLQMLIFPFLIPLSFGMLLHTKRISWALLFLVTLSAGTLYGAMEIAKSPVVVIFMILSAFFYLRRKGRVGIIFIFLVIILFTVFPLFVVSGEYAGEVTYAVALQSLAHRLFYVPSEVLYYYFEVFPHVVPYQHGLTIDKVAMLLGSHAYPSANVVGRYIWPQAMYSVAANAPFLGNLHADFGLTGVVAGGLLAGLVMQFVQIYVVRRPKSIINAACYSVLLINFVNLNHTALPIVLMSDGTLLVLVLASAMKGLEALFRRLLGTTEFVLPASFETQRPVRSY